MFDMVSWQKEILHNMVLTKWLSEEVFSVKWWGVVGFILSSYVLVFYLLDKKRMTKLLLFGSLITVFTLVVDIIGVNFNLWEYKTRVFPLVPSIFLYDLTLLPLYYMLIFQYTANSWKRYTVWNLVAAGFMGFVFTPIAVYIGILQWIRWNYVYAFLTIAAIGFMAKGATSLFEYIEERANSPSEGRLTSRILQPAMKPADNRQDNRDADKD